MESAQSDSVNREQLLSLESVQSDSVNSVQEIHAIFEMFSHVICCQIQLTVYSPKFVQHQICAAPSLCNCWCKKSVISVKYWYKLRTKFVQQVFPCKNQFTVGTKVLSQIELTEFTKC